jgi:TonB family protein
MGFLTNVAVAQNSEKEVSARLIGKPLYLRGFWAEDKLKFDAAGKPLQSYSLVSFTEAGFNAFRVKIHGDHMTIEGQRVGLTFDKSGKYKRQGLILGNGDNGTPELITLEVEGSGTQDFSKALDAIFAGSLEELAPTLPFYWQTYAKGHLVGQPAAGVAEHPDAQNKTPGTLNAGGKVTPPKIVNAPTPEFSVAARRMNYSAKVEVHFWIETDGSCSHVSISKPAGLGLDEQALAAVAQYRFIPAQRDGKPIRVDVYVEVNFQRS